MNGMVTEPRVVDAGRGFAWWHGGFRIFGASIAMWIGVFFIYCLLSVLVNAIPYVGAIGHSLLTPVFMGGLMIGCRALEQGQPLRVSHLFEGFQGAHFVPLMIIGAVNIALVLALMALTGAGILGTARVTSMGDMADPFEAFRGSVPTTGLGILAILVALVVVTVFAMLNWFAPALVALRGVTAIQAMKLSFASCLRNWLPFLVYSLVVLVAGIALTIAIIGLAFVFGAGALLGGSLSGGVGAFVGFMVLLFVGGLVFALVVGPIAIGSVYAGYKDTLDDDDATVTSAAYR